MKIHITKLAIAIMLFTLAGSAFGQINIRLPKIKLPKKDDARPANPEKPNSGGILDRTPTSAAARRSDRQLVIDDGFTFFDAEPLQEYSAEARRQVGIGWHLTSRLRMFGTVPNRSAFKLVVSKAGRDLAVIRCEGTAYRKGEDPVPANRNAPEDDYLLTSRRGCEDKTKAIKGTGKMDVKVYFVNGNTDEEKLLRTYKIDVREAKRVRGLATAPVPDVPHYYIQRHAETSAAILYVRPIGMNQRLGPNYFREAGDGDFHSEIEIYFNISPQRQVDRLKTMSLRCSVNGTPLNFPGMGDQNDQARFRMMRVETAIYTDRLAPQYKRANEYMDEVSFVQYQVRFPILRRGDAANNRLGMYDHKGNWECSVRNNGETLRTFRWQTGSNGLPVEHPEQRSGNINLHHNAYLIEAEVPAGGSFADHRLLPLPNDGVFYGIPWTSAEGKASAAKVPTKGKPYHVSSTGR